MNRFIANEKWMVGLAVFLALLLIATKFLRPDFGVSGLDSLARYIAFKFGQAAKI